MFVPQPRFSFQDEHYNIYNERARKLEVFKVLCGNLSFQIPGTFNLSDYQIILNYKNLLLTFDIGLRNLSTFSL